MTPFSLFAQLIHRLRTKLFSDEVISAPKKSFLIYWPAYGGIKALYTSLYFRGAICLGVIITIVNIFVEKRWDWQGTVIATLPSILGFSLGGYAILVGFGDAAFFSIICKKMAEEKYSLYMRVNASFLHFILVQCVALIYAVLAKALHIDGIILFSFLGTTLYIYALGVIISTCFSVLNLADWFDTMKQRSEDDTTTKK